MLCLICPTPDDQRPSHGGSDFEGLFGDFVSSNEALWWSITGGSYSPWSLPPAWYGDDEAEAAFYGQFTEIPNTAHVVATGAVFRERMKYLNDFWIEVYAFRERPAAIEFASWWSGSSLPQLVGVPRGAEHSFVNVDGSFWAVLSSDHALLRRVSEKWPLSRYLPVAAVDAT